MGKLLMIDNYDSFTYNLVQYFGELGAKVKVFRNDEITLEQIASMQPAQLVISPGPCSPAEAGISVPAIREFAGKPDCLEVTAWTDDGEIMGVRHKTLDIEGVQFHPESILTERGHDLLRNFLDRGDSLPAAA